MSSLHEVLMKHGYEHQGRSTYKKGKFTVTAGENGKSWRHSHNPMGLDIGTNGWGHESLDKHLSQFHSSQPKEKHYRGITRSPSAAQRQTSAYKGVGYEQHAEEQIEPGHITPDRAEEILAGRRTFNGRLV